MPDTCVNYEIERRGIYIYIYIKLFFKYLDHHIYVAILQRKKKLLKYT